MPEKTYPPGRPAWVELGVQDSPNRLDIGGFQVMQRWEEPLMRAMANEAVRSSHDDVLEVGFGMGISAGFVMEGRPRSYTVVEAHPEVAERARAWKANQPVRVTVLEGFFHDVVPRLDEASFDGILFDPYPTDESEWFDFHARFMPDARRLLRPGGVFVYFPMQTSRFDPDHSHALLTNFDEVRMRRVAGLAPPPDCEYWQDDHMIIASGRVDP